MIDLATLGYTVQTSGLSAGEKALDSFERANNSVSKASVEVEKQIKRVDQSVAAINRTVTGGASNVVAFSKATGEVAGKANQASAAVDKLSMGWKTVQVTAQGAGAAADKVAKATDDVAKKTDDAARKLPSYTRAVKDSERAQREAAEEASEFQKRLDEVGQQANRTSAMFQTAIRWAGALGIALSVNALKNYADTWSDVSARVGLAVGDIDGAAPVMARLSDMARRTYSALNLTAESFIANSTSLKELGYNTNQQLDYTEALNNAMVVSGARGERAASITNAMSKAMASGTLRGDELNTIIQSGGRVATVLAERLGVTTNKLRELGADGKITSAIIYDALVGSLETLREEADSMPATIGDAFTLVGNAVLTLVGNFDKATGASAAVASAIIMVADNLQLLLSIGLATAAFFAARYAVSIGVVAVTSTYQLVAANVALHKALFGSSTAGALAATAMRGLSVALIAVRGAIISTGIGALVVALGMAVNWFLNLVKAAGGFGNAISLVGAVINEEMTRWGAWFAAFGLRVDAVMQDVASFVVRMVADGVAVVGQGVNNWIGAYVGAYEAVKAVWSLLPKAIGDLAFQAANFMIQGIEQMLKSAADRVDSFYNSIANSRMGELFGFETINIAGSINFGGVGNPFAGAAAAAGETAGAAFSEGFNRTYVDVDGAVGKLKEISDGSADAAAASREAAGIFDAVAAKPNEALNAVRDLMTETDGVTESLNTVVPAADAAGDAADKAGKKGAKSAKDAADKTKDWATELQKNLTQAVDTVSKAFGDWVSRGFKDFKSFTSSIIGAFQQMLSNMIAMAAKNRIMVSLGLDPLSGALGRAGAVTGGAGGAGMGMISGIAGLGSSMLAGASGMITAASGGISSALTFGQFAMSGMTTGLAGMATAIGAAIPVIGAIVGLVAIGKKLFGRTLKDTGIEATFSMAEGIAANTYKFYKGGWFRSDKTKRETMDKEASDPIGEAFMAVGQSVADLAEKLGLSAERLNDIEFSMKFSTKGMSEDEIAERFAKEMERYGDTLVRDLLPRIDQFAQGAETSVETMTRLATSLERYNITMDVLGLRLKAVSVAGADAASSFIDLMGGMEAFQAAADYYYQNFYSLQERYDNAVAAFNESMSDINVRRAPQSMEEYRALIERMDAAGNEEAVAQLLLGAQAFQQMLEMGNQLEEQANAITEAQRQRADMERQLLSLQGNTVAIRQLELAALDPTNRALQRQIWAQERLNAISEEREGLERALLQAQGNTAALRQLELAGLDATNRALQRQIWQTEHANAVAEERAGLERQMLEAQGDTAALRRLELEALYPANRALQQQIWAQERATEVLNERQGLERRLMEVMGDTAGIRALELAALAPANRALQRRIWHEEQLLAIAQERQGLERRLLEVQGNTAAIRQLELSALDASNRALQIQIWALEDQAEAAQAAAEVASERAELESQWQTLLGNTVWLRAKELEGLDASNRALQQHIWALEDAQEAHASAEEAARNALGVERDRIEGMKTMADGIRNLAMEAMQATNSNTEAQRQLAERQLRVALETGKIWDDSVSDLASKVANLDSSNFSSYNDFLRASARASSLLNEVADNQMDEAMTAEERLEAALAKYGLQDETVLGLTEALLRLDEAIDHLASVRDGSVVAPSMQGGQAGFGTPPDVVVSPIQQQHNAQAAQQSQFESLRDEIRRLREENNLGNAQIARQAKYVADIERQRQAEGMPPVREDAL